MTRKQLRLFTAAQGWKGMSADVARQWFDRFCAQSLDLGRFCKKEQVSVTAFRSTMRSYFAEDWDTAVKAKASSQTPYKLGRAFEYRVMRQLETQGFIVLRSPGSKSPIDVIAVKRGAIWFVQCKRGGSISPEEWNTFYDLAMSVHATPVLAMMPTGRGTQLFRMTGPKTTLTRTAPMEPAQLSA